MHGLKKRCKTCVDEIMKKIDNSFQDHNTDSQLLLQNNDDDNQVNNTIEILIIMKIMMNTRVLIIMKRMNVT